MNKLTEKQQRFADEYLIDCNATRAYRAAYPNCKKDSSADAAARKLLGNTRIRQYIDEKLEEISSKKTADAKEVIEYLTSVMRGEAKSEVLAFKGEGFQEVIKKHPDEKERISAANTLAKIFGIDKQQGININSTMTVIVDDLENDDS